MAPLVSALHLALAAGIVLLMCGVALGWASVSVAKRVVGVIVALLGAIVGLAALGAPQAMMIAGAAALFAYVTMGVGLLARLQEAYGATDVADIDRGDADAEPAEPSA
jgi:hypothetical protein